MAEWMEKGGAAARHRRENLAAPSDLENFGGLRAAFIWPPFLQAVGIDHRV